MTLVAGFLPVSTFAWCRPFYLCSEAVRSMNVCDACAVELAAYLQSGRGADVRRWRVSLPALQSVDVSDTRTWNKEQLASTLPDLHVQEHTHTHTLTSRGHRTHTCSHQHVPCRRFQSFLLPISVVQDHTDPAQRRSLSRWQTDLLPWLETCRSRNVHR